MTNPRTTPDARYGAGHRPQPRKVPGGWETGCSCGCDRADSVGAHATPDDARADSAQLLTLAEHGPGRDAR